MIVQRLSEIQHRHGYLPEGELKELSQRINEPLHRIHEVASFFPHYRLKPGPDVDVRVCRDMACHLHGAKALQAAMEGVANEFGGGQVAVDGVSCLGQCDHAPAVTVNDMVYWDKSPLAIRGLVERALAKEELPRQHAPTGRLDWKIDPYGGEPTYEAIRQYVETRDADGLLKKLEVSTLRGMGGARFPTFRKWSAVRGAPGAVKYAVVNGDESEPGTFKDRELLRRAPHLVVEGVILSGLVTGATKGWIYIRHEYDEEIEAVREEIERAKAKGVVGHGVLGSDMDFDLEVFVSPGGYICGEESALIEAMEDKRAEPRNKPPFMVYNGLYGKPTVMNNVETMSWVPAILLKGAEWYRDQGVNGSQGLWFVSVSGDVKRPGVFEIPFGLTVGELIDGCCGGMADGQEFKAIAPSGPSGGVIPATIPAKRLPPKFAAAYLPEGSDTYNVRTLPLDPAKLSTLDNMLGAAIVIVGDKANIVDFALNCVEFYKNESCGKCVPCRMGSRKLTELIRSLMAGNFPRERLGLIEELAKAMYATSICGLGMVVPNPIVTVLKYFPEEVEPYLAR
jgi:NADH:ubiquinone oxidoreductase subunit F (NADH-binding)/NADH:ubiquinone oxidoreductase subunit E